MDCPDARDPSHSVYLDRINRRVVKERVPVSGTIDLTYRCPMDCIHCYLGPTIGRTGQGELDTSRWISLVDEIADAGCLYLLISGGDPLLRHDFAQIYTRTKERGMLVTVFTSGLPVKRDTLALFADLPPQQVEISLYGATAATYERITGVRGSFARCMAGIEALVGSGVRVGLKTVLMDQNLHEFEAIARIAADFGVGFRFDAALFPRLNGDPGPMALRVAPADAVALEMADPEKFRQWQSYFARERHGRLPDRLYACGAGVTNFYIDPYGNLTPCLMIPDPAVNLAEGRFLDGWRDVVPRLHEKKTDSGFACLSCEKRVLCGFCPAFFLLENGHEQIPSAFLCEMGHRRYEAIAGSGSISD